MHQYDVIIVGGGGAGLLLARELGNKKHKVLVIDKNTNLLDFSFYTLASFINLEKFNLTKNVVSENINKIWLHSKNFKTKIKCELYTLDKKAVHKELLEAINTDFVDFKLGIQIKEIVEENKLFTTVKDKNNNSYSAKIFVDATGTAGVLSKQLGLRDKQNKLATGVEYNAKYLGKPDQIYLLLGKTYKGGYGWIFPLKNNRAIIGFGTTDNTLKKGLKRRLDEIVELPEIKKLIQLDSKKVEGGSIPITPVIEKFVLKNLVCVGDSVSQVNPIVGEGYKFIFESAVIASRAIDSALIENDISLLNNYEKTWKNRFLSNYKRSKIRQEQIEKFSKSDLMIDFGMLLSKLRSNKKNLESLSGEYEN
ncbi:lycopene cyclase family protein [Polaribacter septentrionalilitoris]|uniref:lycopene cyclase family protein n=1 Tax=Polaribacter septentrionalilitoris TaxID=2494657 RepID=UPI001357AEA8|nr:NAD(P)/FAD-dependent oxidoreductase [Polaribacter septentrionalilitoris]